MLPVWSGPPVGACLWDQNYWHRDIELNRGDPGALRTPKQPGEEWNALMEGHSSMYGVCILFVGVQSRAPLGEHKVTKKEVDGYYVFYGVHSTKYK